MPSGPPFVGRTDELRRFKEVLESPHGQGVVVLGQQGMGKTLLVNRMANAAAKHPSLQCDTVRFEVTENDLPAAVMELMIDRAFEVGGTERSWDDTERPRKQRLALIKLIPGVGDALAELLDSLRRDPKRSSREQLIERLQLVSSRMHQNARAVFVIDPEKYMEKSSASEWRIVVKSLPERIKFIFAQRPDDVLASSREFLALDNVVRTPEECLDSFDEPTVDDLIQARADKLTIPIADVRKALARYAGHPYAVAAAVGMLIDGCKVGDLPADPTREKVAEAQWDGVCDKHGKEAISLFEAYALLEVAVPNEVAEAVAGKSSAARKKLTADPYLRGLLREESDGRRVYHSLLADHVAGQVSPEDARAFHQRAVTVYRKRLTADAKPDSLSARRLAEHVLATGGSEAFVHSFVNECVWALILLGHLDQAISSSLRGMGMVQSGGAEEATLSGNLGLIYQTRGGLDKAEAMHNKSLAINKKLGHLEGMANQYGNLGNTYYECEMLDRAEEMLNKSLAIHKKIGRLEGMANQYANLGTVYKQRGDLTKTRGCWTRARDLFAKIGMTQRVEQGQGLLDGLRPECDADAEP